MGDELGDGVWVDVEGSRFRWCVVGDVGDLVVGEAGEPAILDDDGLLGTLRVAPRCNASVRSPGDFVEVDRDADPARGESTGVEDDDSAFNDDELNNTNSRESRSIANKRGRQPRRGSTASELSEVQKYWGDHNSGKSADEDGDEDEDDDITPV